MRLKRKLSEMSEEKSEENVGTIENVVEKKEQGSIASFFTKTTTTKKRKTIKKKTKTNQPQAARKFVIEYEWSQNPSSSGRTARN